MSNILYLIIIYPITQILEFTFFVSQMLFKESGISIIFISVVVSVLCLPLYAVAEKWQGIERDIQKKLKHKTDTIKNVFKGDERYMILSAYYRQNNYHPVYALRSTFGVLIQIPFFIAAYSYLSNLEAIKSMAFWFIKDLGAPDALFAVNGFTVNLLPILMTLINCAAGALYTRGFPLKDKIQLYGMAGIFLFLLYNSPSALVLYWTTNNVFSLIKNIYYQITLKHKRVFLTALFSAACFILAAFCLIRYGGYDKGVRLAYTSFVAAVIPWAVILLNKFFPKITHIEFDSGRSIGFLLLSALLIWSLAGIFLPSQLIAASPQEFSFIDNYANPIAFIINTALQVFGLFVFWPVCLYMLFSPAVKKYFAAAFLAAALGMIMNAFLFSGNYGIISVNMIFANSISHPTGMTSLNFYLLLIPITLAFLLNKIKQKNISFALISVCVFSLLGVSFINIVKINSSFNELERYYVNEQKDIKQISPLFPLSRNGKNVVILMLDRAISGFIPEIFKESPDLKEQYSGFFYYPNTVSFNGYTRMGSPPVFGGYEYTPEEINKRADLPLVEKHNQSLIMLPRIFSENGFTVCVTDPPYANYNQKSDLSIFDAYPNIKSYITDSQYTDLWIKDNNLELPSTSQILKRNMFWYSLIKCLPVFFRHPLYMDGDWCSTVSNNSLRLTLNGYSVLDYLPRLSEITSGTANTLLVMTNNTTHEGSFLQAPEYVPSINVTNYGTSRFSHEWAYHINAAALKRLADWFTFLKKENVYNNTRIILVSDHGPEPNFSGKRGLPFNVDQFNPLLMVKDFDSLGEIKTDTAFMSNADVPFLSLTGLIDNPKNPFTGSPISVERKKEPLYIAVSGAIHLSSGTQFGLDPSGDYFVHDNIFDAKNWTPVLDENKK